EAASLSFKLNSDDEILI
ncbi:MAG: hypothetical protein QG610_274, partial [Euryarchaeota archaeon]|nr:hypothetical protein [Euryarchaeota archaeon]